MRAHEIEREIRGHGRPRGGHPLTLMDACQLAEIVIRECRREACEPPQPTTLGEIRARLTEPQGGVTGIDRKARGAVIALIDWLEDHGHALRPVFIGEPVRLDCAGEDHSATRPHGC